MTLEDVSRMLADVNDETRVSNARHILVIDDGTPSARNAVWRAAYLARERGAELALLHSPSKGSAPGPAASQAKIEALCADLAQRLAVHVRPVAPGPDLVADMRAASAGADLLVIGTARSNPLRSLLGGTQADRVIRLCRVPTLVVRRPAIQRPASTGAAAPQMHYARALAAVDLTHEAQQVLAAAAHYAPHARFEVVHAQAARGWSRRKDKRPESHAGPNAMDAALARLDEIVAAALPGPVATSVRYGDAAEAVLARQRAIAAELIVIGKRQRGLLADFLLGGVTRAVLAGSEADVLIVPTEPETAAARG
ncbi:universal stress protein [Ramlibacter sp.]|uniref:universal stress protein n=1 Tax=Ramlibacter sp. TaxID=1917967 RepID=UPI003D0DB3B2